MTHLRNIRPKTIGILVNSLGDFAYPLCQGVSEGAKGQDIDVIIFSLTSAYAEHKDGANAHLYLNETLCLISKASIDGLVINTCVSDFVDKQILEAFIQQHPELFFITISVPLVGATQIVADNKHGMKEAVTHLIQKHNHRRIGFISGPPNNTEVKDRFAAYQDALQENNIQVDSNLIVVGDWYWDSGGNAVTTLLDERKCEFDALVAANDNMACGAIEELRKRGYQVPGDISVTGFDNSRHANAFELTSVHQSVSSRRKTIC